MEKKKTEQNKTNERTIEHHLISLLTMRLQSCTGSLFEFGGKMDDFPLCIEKPITKKLFMSRKLEVKVNQYTSGYI